MIRDRNCKNKSWRAEELEALVKERVREVLQSPELAMEIAEAQRQKEVTEVNSDNTPIEKRIREIDRQIDKFMELYQVDGIPADVLAVNINKLYNEKTSLQEMLQPKEVPSDNMPFDLVEELLKDAAQIWDFADDLQKRKIVHSLIKKITIYGEKVEIEWNF